MFDLSHQKRKKKDGSDRPDRNRFLRKKGSQFGSLFFARCAKKKESLIS